MAVSGRQRSQILPSETFDRSQRDCDYHEDQNDGSNIAHRRVRSAQCTSATPNTTDAIPIHCAIIVASYAAVEMTGGTTPCGDDAPVQSPMLRAYVSRSARYLPLAAMPARSLAHVCQIVVRRCQWIFDLDQPIAQLSGSTVSTAMAAALSFVMTRVRSWLGPAARGTFGWPASKQSGRSHC